MLCDRAQGAANLFTVKIAALLAAHDNIVFYQRAEGRWHHESSLFVVGFDFSFIILSYNFE